MALRAIMPAMLILDRHRALDFLIAASMRAEVPEPFVRLAPNPASEEVLQAATQAPVTIEAALHVEPAAEPASAATSALARRPADTREPASLLAGWWRGIRSPVAWSA